VLGEPFEHRLGVALELQVAVPAAGAAVGQHVVVHLVEEGGDADVPGPLDLNAGQGEGWRSVSSGMENASSRAMYLISGSFAYNPNELPPLAMIV
jgi:hypothetical protein